MRTLRPLVAGATTAVLLMGTAYGEEVRWERAALGAGQRGSLDLVFEDTRPAGRVTLPAVDGLEVLGPPGQTANTSIINGTRSESMTLSFPVRAEAEGSITIPSFEVETADGTNTVAPLTIAVGAATIPGAQRGSAAKISDVVDARMTPTNMTPYAGQVFDLGVIVGLNEGRRGEVVGTPSWRDPGVVAEPWSEGKPVSTENGFGVRFHTRAVAPQSGRIEIAPVEQEVAIEVGRARVDPFDDFDDAFGSLRKFGGVDLLDSFFSRAQKTTATVRSNAVQLDVQPLPQPAPPGFSGAVGQFELSSNIAPAQLKTGEPITWTLALKGTGNWPGSVALPSRAVPADFRTLQPKQHKEFAPGELFTGALTEDVVLVPNQPGDYQLEPVRFVYFDPVAGKYQTIDARPPVLHITGAPIASQPAVSAPAPAAAAHNAPAPAPVNAAAGAPVAPVVDAPLPRDPLSGSATAFAPMSGATVAWLAGAPVVLLILYWIGLAIRHARLTDPRRPQRQAFRQLAAAIEQVRQATSAEQRIATLLAWQHTAATALCLDLAAPTAEQLADQRWIDLWAGSERALYGREHMLPGGWCDRALAVCTRRRRPRFNPLRAFTVRNLVPKTAAAALLLAIAAAPARAAEPADPYTNGDFAAAREQLLARVKDEPADWIARYNLGLAAAQLGDLPRALGETTAAFVHAPHSEAVRWNARAFASRVPGFDRAAAAMITNPGLAALASPAVWQALLIAAAFVGCSGAALILWRRYGGTPARSRVGLALLALAVVVGGGAAASLRSYGPMADPRAALVAGQPVLRSVPTDAEPPQQQKPLPAGTLVAVERDFLGWVKVDLRNGETGWLRHGDLVPLYAAPSA